MSDPTDPENGGEPRLDPVRVPPTLDDRLTSVVSVRTRIPGDALTAPVLGTERAGHGVVIGEHGLVLTIGYLITEADSVWLTDHEGVSVPGHVVGYDQETGFGLVQALQSTSWRPVPLGNSGQTGVTDPVTVAGFGGSDQVVEATVVAKREFAGYWEYVLDEAMFTAPAHPSWGGAAVLDAEGRLVGVGSLLVQQVTESGTTMGANMIVPIDLLKPILDDLLSYGRQNKPARPWLGWLVQDAGEQLVVAGVYDAGPADRADVRVGDVVTEVAEHPVSELAELFRTIWSLGEAGVEVPLTLVRDDATLSRTVASVDRDACLKPRPIH